MCGTLILTTASTLAAVYWSAHVGRQNLAKIGAIASTGVYWTSSCSVVLSDMLTPRGTDPRSSYLIMQDGYLPTLLMCFVLSSIIVGVLGAIVGLTWERSSQRGQSVRKTGE